MLHRLSPPGAPTAAAPAFRDELSGRSSFCGHQATPGLPEVTLQQRAGLKEGCAPFIVRGHGTWVQAAQPPSSSLCPEAVIRVKGGRCSEDSGHSCVRSLPSLAGVERGGGAQAKALPCVPPAWAEPEGPASRPQLCRGLGKVSTPSAPSLWPPRTGDTRLCVRVHTVSSSRSRIAELFT